MKYRSYGLRGRQYWPSAWQELLVRNTGHDVLKYWAEGVTELAIYLAGTIGEILGMKYCSTGLRG